MKQLTYCDDWPESWKTAYKYDTAEFWGETKSIGYRNCYLKRREVVLDMVRNHLPKGSSILDVAAAQGNFSLPLAEEGYDVTWNDLRSELAGYVELKHEKGQIHYAPGNAFELAFPALFDGVIITEIIEHVAHPDEFLQKIATLVRPGGYVFMSTPNGGYFKNNLPKFSECLYASVFESIQFKSDSDGHIFLIHEDEFAPLAKAAGLELREVSIFTNPLTHGHVKLGLLLKVLPNSIVKGIEAATNALPRPLVRKLHSNTAVLFQKPDSADRPHSSEAVAVKLGVEAGGG